MNARKIISVAGAGGKTTMIHSLRDRYLAEGRSVLVTTTTKMYIEENTDISCSLESITASLEKDSYCMAGSPSAESGKIAALPAHIMEAALQAADVVLIEADGAKHYPAKYPAAYEPVIYPGSTEVILVMGLDAIGRRVDETVFRADEYARAGLGNESDIVTFDTLETIIHSGYLSRIDKAVRVIVLYSKMNEEGELVYISDERAGKLFK